MCSTNNQTELFDSENNEYDEKSGWVFSRRHHIDGRKNLLFLSGADVVIYNIVVEKKRFSLSVQRLTWLSHFSNLNDKYLPTFFTDPYNLREQAPPAMKVLFQNIVTVWRDPNAFYEISCILMLCNAFFGFVLLFSPAFAVSYIPTFGRCRCRGTFLISPALPHPIVVLCTRRERT